MPSGFLHRSSFLSETVLRDIHGAITAVAAEAPPIHPTMASGAPLRMRVTSCGEFGWFSARGRYSYLERHPETGRRWPPIPAVLRREIDRALAEAGVGMRPESCLINFYESDGRLGLHQDRDERNLTAPIVSFSLGDACEFLIGGTSRAAPTRSVLLQDGDLVVMAGEARLAFHGVNRIFPSSARLPTTALGAARINITVRQVF